jgi:hypothetical protein
MSRVEETHQKALEKYKGDTAMVYISRGNFKSGAEWADQTLVEKIIDLLYQELYEGNISVKNIEDVINKIRKTTE